MIQKKSYGYQNRGNGKNEERFMINESIRFPELLVVTADGENLGKLSSQEALKAARERELDLVVISEQATPPVAKIIDFSKFKYEQQKKKKKTLKNKSAELKEIWFKAFIGDGDIEHKLRKVKEFIEDKNNVKLTIKRKRHVNAEHVEKLMARLLEQVGEYSKIINVPKFSGPNFSAIIAPK